MKKIKKILIVVLVFIFSIDLIFLTVSALVIDVHTHVKCTYEIREKVTIEEAFKYYTDETEKAKEIEKMLKEAKMTSKEKEDFYKYTDTYRLVRYTFILENSSEYHVYVKHFFERTENVWFLSVPKLLYDKPGLPKCGPYDGKEDLSENHTAWTLCALEKLGKFEEEVRAKCFKPLVYVKVSGGPYVTMFFATPILDFSNDN